MFIFSFQFFSPSLGCIHVDDDYFYIEVLFIEK